MKLKLLLIGALIFFISSLSWSQTYVSSDPDSVCAGATNVVYRIPPASSVPSSSYNWSVSGSGTIVPQASDDSIYVNWSSTPGTSQVMVSETNASGCTSPQAILNVVRYRPTATLSGGPFSVCAGTNENISLIVTFTGRAPYSVTYSITNGLNTIGPFTASGIEEKVHTINVSIPGVSNPGTYTGSIISASDKDGCIATSISGNISLVISQPAAATASVTSQPSCSIPSGSISVTAPTGAGITYSIGGAYQSSGIFNNVDPGTYTVTAKDANGCVSPPSTSVVINAAPSSPASPNASISIQTDCSTSTGAIVISSPTGSGITYSLDGTNYQASATFSDLPPGSYSFTAKNTDGCISGQSSLLTINPKPPTPSTPIIQHRN